MLTASGVLQRCLPELDDALLRRPALELDPLAALRFDRLSRVHELSQCRANRRTAREVCSRRSSSTHAATIRPQPYRSRAVPSSGSVSAEGSNSRSLRSWPTSSCSAPRLVAPTRCQEEAVLQIAVHLGSVEQADALYLLSRGAGELDRLEAEQMRRCTTSCARARASGARRTGSRNEVERRRVSRADRDCTPSCANALAPHRVLRVVHTPAELARQAALCEPAPGRDEVRVAVARTDDEVRVEVVARDRVGLLARTTRVLFEADCSIEQAWATTWADGTALASYGCARGAPDAEGLRTRLAALLGDAVSPRPCRTSSSGSTTRARRGTRAARSRAPTDRASRTR